MLVSVEAGVLAILGDVDARADVDDPLRSERLSSSRSAKASAIATSLTPESAVRACPAAPVPRPPQPTRPTLIVLLPAAWTRGTVKPVETAVAVAAPITAAVEPFRKSRREADADDECRGLARGSSVEVGQSRQDLLWSDQHIPVGMKRRDPHPTWSLW